MNHQIIRPFISKSVYNRLRHRTQQARQALKEADQVCAEFEEESPQLELFEGGISAALHHLERCEATLHALRFPKAWERGADDD